MKFDNPFAAIFVALVCLLSAPSDLRGQTEENAQDAPPAGESEEDAAEEDRPVGFELGRFHIKNFLPAEGAKTTLSFTLFAAVESERADKFEMLLENRRNRVRQQVIIASRLAEQSDFEDPELTRLRRRVMVRLYRALPELQIDELYFSEFTYLSE